MRRLLGFLFAALLAAVPASAQTVQSFSPTGAVALSVSNSSARVAFATAGPTALITNTGANAAYLKFGGSTITAAVTDYLLGPGCSIAYNVNGQPDVAAITASSTTALTIITGSGLPTLPQNACVQSITISGGTVTANTVPTPAATTDASGTITTGGTFQTLAAAAPTRKSLAFTNICNKSGNCTATTNYCYLYIAAAGSGATTNSIAVPPGSMYLRSSGVVPNDAISGTCDGTGDHFQLSVQ